MPDGFNIYILYVLITIKACSYKGVWWWWVFYPKTDPDPKIPGRGKPMVVGHCLSSDLKIRFKDGTYNLTWASNHLYPHQKSNLGPLGW